MNKFKCPVSEGRDPEDYTRRRDEVHLLGVLDKCTQILRDDRIWLRNKLKEGEQDVIQIFKKHINKRPMDMSALQVNLRKHVTKIKDKSKKEQLQKFKENMNAATNNSLYEKQYNNQYERGSKSIPKKFVEPKLYFEDEEMQPESILRNYSRPKPEYKAFEEYQASNKKKNPLYRMEMTDPIEEEEEMEQNLTSQRSRSEQNKQNILNSKNISQKTQDDRFTLPWNKPVSSFPRRQQERSIPFSQRERQYIEPAPQAEFNLEMTEPPMLNRNKNLVMQSIDRVEESYSQSNILSSQVESNMGSNFRTSVMYCHNQTTYCHNEVVESVSKEFVLELNSEEVLPSPSFSGTPLASQMMPAQRHAVFQYNHPSTVPTPPLSNSSHLRSPTTDDEQLFTNPQLLMECRRFLEKSGAKQTDHSYEPEVSHHNITYPEENKFQLSHFNNNSSNHFEGLAQKAKDCVSETKPHQRSPMSSEKHASSHSNVLPILMVVESFDRDMEEASSGSQYTHNHTHTYTHTNHQQKTQLIQDISSLYAEDVFDIIFPSSNPIIDLHTYEQVISRNFCEKERMLKLFKLGDKNLDNNLLATDFGRLLLTVCNYKPSPNLVKEIFSLIDIERRGYFSLDDYERFLEQVVDTEDPESPGVINTCSELFEQADISRAERVEYWGLYLTRNSPQFVEFSTFLEQFQFEVV